MHPTHFIYSYVVPDIIFMVKNHSDSERKEGNVLFNDALNTIYFSYMVSDIW